MGVCQQQKEEVRQFHRVVQCLAMHRKRNSYMHISPICSQIHSRVCVRACVRVHSCVCVSLSLCVRALMVNRKYVSAHEMYSCFGMVVDTHQ